MPLGRRKVLELSVVMTGAAMTGFAGVLGSACGSDDTGTTKPPVNDNKEASTGSDTGTTKNDASSDTGAKVDAPAGVVCRASITQNHGHTIAIPLADLDSSTPKTYGIKGSSDHDHQVTLDPTDLSQLKAGVSVQKTSTNGGTTHDHQVTILCT